MRLANPRWYVQWEDEGRFFESLSELESFLDLCDSNGVKHETFIVMSGCIRVSLNLFGLSV